MPGEHASKVSCLKCDSDYVEVVERKTGAAVETLYAVGQPKQGTSVVTADGSIQRLFQCRNCLHRWPAPDWWDGTLRPPAVTPPPLPPQLEREFRVGSRVKVHATDSHLDGCVGSVAGVGAMVVEVQLDDRRGGLPFWPNELWSAEAPVPAPAPAYEDEGGWLFKPGDRVRIVGRDERPTPWSRGKVRTLGCLGTVEPDLFERGLVSVQVDKVPMLRQYSSECLEHVEADREFKPGMVVGRKDRPSALCALLRKDGGGWESVCEHMRHLVRVDERSLCRQPLPDVSGCFSADGDPGVRSGAIVLLCEPRLANGSNENNSKRVGTAVQVTGSAQSYASDGGELVRGIAYRMFDGGHAGSWPARDCIFIGRLDND